MGFLSEFQRKLGFFQVGIGVYTGDIYNPAILAGNLTADTRSTRPGSGTDMKF